MHVEFTHIKLITLRQEHLNITLRQEHLNITLRQEHLNITLRQEHLNSHSQQFYQYQQDEQPPVTSDN